MTEHSFEQKPNTTPEQRVIAYWKQLNDRMGIVPATDEQRAGHMARIRQILGGEETTEQPESVASAPELPTNLQLLSLVIDYYAYDNMVRGMRSQLHADESEFKERYEEKDEDPAAVYAGAQRKRDYMHFPYEEALQVLFKKRNTTLELGPACDTEDFVSFKQALEDTYGGAGPEFQRARKKLRDKIELIERGQIALDVFAADEQSEEQ